MGSAAPKSGQRDNESQESPDPNIYSIFKSPQVKKIREGKLTIYDNNNMSGKNNSSGARRSELINHSQNNDEARDLYPINENMPATILEG